MFENSKWIWINNKNNADEYADFYAEFELSSLVDTNLNISVDGNFEAYLNGELCAFGSCADYSFYKFYDSFSLDRFCHVGKNCLKITVWHIGCSSSVYSMADPGLLFEVTQFGKNIISSGADILSRKNINYTNGMCKIITGQVGPSYRYDNSVINQIPFAKSLEVDKTDCINARGIENLKLLPRIPVSIEDNGERILIDWGKEAVGYVDLDFVSVCQQELKIVFGEHLDDEGKVPQYIGSRDFSIGFYTKAGDNKFLGMMRRIAGRYLEIWYEKPISVKYIGIRPVVYPLKYRAVSFKNELHRRIYDTCVYTLECCMHEHYEDCPWREQALYSLDSRNQMLCGYVAFKEYRYPRYNIILLAKSLRNGILRITSPTDTELPIPFFSLTFVQQVYEYVKFSGDMSIIDEVKFALDAIMSTFAARIDESGMIAAFPPKAWNFYEWTTGNDGSGQLPTDQNRYDLCLNAMYIYVLPMYESLGGVIDVDKERIAEGLKSVLFDKVKGLYKNTSVDGRFSVIGNSLAILAGIGGKKIAEKIVSERSSITDLTLSMNGYFYDALLSVDESYRDYIIKDIEDKYSYMLSCGATTFWETLDGWHAFSDAGSLCHGWSSLPIYYLHILGLEE